MELLAGLAFGAAEAVHDAGSVGVGLQAADAPHARVAEGAIVEVHGVLRGEDHADAEGARLLHEGDERALGRRVRGVRREEVRATIITSQLDPKHWHDYLADPTTADAICDRVLHAAHRIALKGPSRRSR